MSFTIFVTAPRLAPTGLRILEQAGCRVLFLADTGGGAAVEEMLTTEPVDAVISRTTPLSARAIRSCPTLRVISKHGVGVSNIDVAAASARGIPVYVTPGSNAASVAELTLGLMLAAARRIPWLHDELRAGRWSRTQDGLQLGGRRLGLVGLGQVGQRVARVALALGMRVAAFDPHLRGPSPVADVTLRGSLEELLAEVDVLSLHIPLTSDTEKLIGRRELGLLPAGAVLVNTARGEVIDEPALLEALQSRHLFAAGLDTMVQEPLPAGSPLAASPYVVLTPHVGGSTAAALDGMAECAARNVVGYLRGDLPPLASCVNAEVLPPPAAAGNLARTPA